MRRALLGTIANVLLGLAGLLAAYSVERFAIAFTGTVWRLQITSAGLTWFVCIGALLAVLALFSGAQLRRHRRSSTDVAAHEHDTDASEPEQSKIALPLRSVMFVVAVACIALGVRGIGVEGVVAPDKPDPVILRPPAVNRERIVVETPLAVYFRNGDAELDGASKVYLRELGQMLLECKIADVSLVGLSSGARYASAHETRNPRLANMRMGAVKRELDFVVKTRVGVSIAKEWGLDAEMESSRYVRDTTPSGGRRLAAERFNRRVDIRLPNLGECSNGSP